MKTKFLFIAYWITLTCYAVNSDAQTNRQLSNLISPTAVNQSLLPNTDNTRNLGSATRSWKDLYADGSIYLGGVRFLAYKTGTGTGNTAVGSGVLNANSSGLSNTGTGFSALFSNTTGGANTAFGYSALYRNTTGQENSAFGLGALYSNTTGTYNSAFGYSALLLNTTGPYNTANGHRALYFNTTGFRNVANGSYALYSNTTGGGNTANGYGAGYFNNNKFFCTFLGYNADQDASVTTDLTYSMALGSSSRITAKNQVRIGNTFVTSIGGYEPWTNLSDGRFKKNVKDNVPGLAFINQLHAITYTIDVTSLRNFLGEDRQNEIITAEGKTVGEKNPEAEALIQKGIEEKEKIIRTGFSAQEVEEAAKNIGYDFSGLDKPANEHTPYGLRYSEFVVPLVKAVQELDAKNKKLTEEAEELKTLKQQVAELRQMIMDIKNGNTNTNVSLSSAYLKQNTPNPSTVTTLIHYYVPVTTTSAQLLITNMKGQTVKTVVLNSKGNGKVTFNTNDLAAGTYTYSLFVDKKQVDSKQLLIKR